MRLEKGCVFLGGGLMKRRARVASAGHAMVACCRSVGAWLEMKKTWSMREKRMRHRSVPCKGICLLGGRGGSRRWTRGTILKIPQYYSKGRKYPRFLNYENISIFAPVDASLLSTKIQRYRSRVWFVDDVQSTRIHHCLYLTRY